MPVLRGVVYRKRALAAPVPTLPGELLMARPALDRGRIDPAIAALRQRGASASRIARALGISERTVRYALRRLAVPSPERKAA